MHRSANARKPWVVLKLLLDAGADFNRPDKNGGTPLSYASKERLAGLLRLLLGKWLTQIGTDGDVNVTDAFGRSPLYYYSRFGDAKTVKCLLDAGANLNRPDKNGQTPLYPASQDGHAEVVKLLLDADADPNLADKYGFTPLFWASIKDNVATAVQLLLDADADPDLADQYGQTPLYWACLRGHTEVSSRR